MSFYKITNQTKNLIGRKDHQCCWIPITTIENLSQDYNYGNYIRKVIIPEGSTITKERNHYYIDQVILGDRYPLLEVQTIQKFNLKITKTYIEKLGKLGKLNTLKHIVKNSLYKESLIPCILDILYQQTYFSKIYL